VRLLREPPCHQSHQARARPAAVALPSAHPTRSAARSPAAENCGDVITYSGVDFPRAMNVYVIGEQPPTDWVGYAFAPGATDDVTYGHIGLTWTTLSTGRLGPSHELARSAARKGR
jgi:hypothetical protein